MEMGLQQSTTGTGNCFCDEAGGVYFKLWRPHISMVISAFISFVFLLATLKIEKILFVSRSKQRNSLDNFYCHSALSATLIHFTYIVTFIICQHLTFVTISLFLLKILKGSQRHVPNNDQFLSQCPDPTLANLGTSMLFKQWEMVIDVIL